MLLRLKLLKIKLHQFYPNNIFIFSNFSSKILPYDLRRKIFKSGIFQ